MRYKLSELKSIRIDKLRELLARDPEVNAVAKAKRFTMSKPELILNLIELSQEDQVWLRGVVVPLAENQVFTGEQSASLAYLIWIRWNKDYESAASAWRRLLQNNCPESAFTRLAKIGEYLEEYGPMMDRLREEIQEAVPV